MNKTEKIIERVRKLLAMSKDTGSPNEAAIAAKRARFLMDEYQLTEMDLTKIESSDMGASYQEGKKTVSSFDGVLAVAVAEFNDCQVKYERNKLTYKLDIRFEGMLVDTVCAVELFRYLKGQAYKQAVRYEEGRKNRHAYRVGFASGVARQVKQFLLERAKLKTAGGTSLIVCKQQLVAQHFKPVKYKSSGTKFSGDRSSFQSGVVAGQKAGLNRQVSGEQRGQLT